MAYSRPPVQAGRGLTRSPGLPESSTGVFDYALDSDVSTTTTIGMVQVGSGLAITPAGILSATGGSNDNCSVHTTLTKTDYTATADDCYIGATNSSHDDDDDENSSITITLPLGVSGKLYYIKNQGTGNIKVQGTSGQTIDGSSSKTLGTNSGFIVVFAGLRWNIL
jgi:hypothetical protein